MQKKSLDGNVMLKVDLAKAFNTLEWKFILKVLKKFGYNKTFYT